MLNFTKQYPDQVCSVLRGQIRIRNTVQRCQREGFFFLKNFLKINGP
jgi:hypothetical protein